MRLLKSKKISDIEFDMSTKGNREANIKRDWELAKQAKSPIQEELKMLDDYYLGNHYSKDKLIELAAKNGSNFVPPIITDCFKVVEQSIDNVIPDFMFKGRDNDLDSQLAKEREDMVRYVVYNNNIEGMMSENERNLGKSKNAFWKVSWNENLRFCEENGDIEIGNPNPANIFPDPSAYDIDSCEYICYAYRMHRLAARRQFGNVLDELTADNKHEETEIYNNSSFTNFSEKYNSSSNSQYRNHDNTLQVVEYWFRQPEKGHVTNNKVKYEWESGAIACSIVIDDIEVQYIPCYWKDTKCSMYPFVKYCRVPLSQSFWDRSDIENIKDLVEAGDKELNSALLNNEFNANDIIIAEEECLAEGQSITNTPGDVIQVRQGKINGIRRLGGTANSNNSLNTINWLQNSIEETNGNNGVNSGEKPPSNVTTFSGMALLAEQGSKRTENKKLDRKLGFKRLYELIDYSVLEFYNTKRLVTVRGKDGISKMFTFKSDKHQVGNTDMMANENQNVDEQQLSDEEYFKMRDKYKYYPRVDTEMVLTDPVAQSRAMTIQATAEIMKSLDNLTPVKARLLKVQIELMQLPDRDDLIKAIDDVIEEQEAVKAMQKQQLQEQMGQQSQIPPNGVDINNSPQMQQQGVIPNG